MKILITGSEGFIGSHLVEKLISKGAKKLTLLFNIIHSIILDG